MHIIKILDFLKTSIKYDGKMIGWFIDFIFILL